MKTAEEVKAEAYKFAREFTLANGGNIDQVAMVWLCGRIAGLETAEHILQPEEGWSNP